MSKNLPYEGRINLLQTAAGIVNSIKGASKADDGIIILIDSKAEQVKLVTVKTNLLEHRKMLETALRMINAAIENEAKTHIPDAELEQLAAPAGIPEEAQKH